VTIREGDGLQFIHKVRVRLVPINPTLRLLVGSEKATELTTMVIAWELEPKRKLFFQYIPSILSLSKGIKRNA
jgi:hypothetical protein